MIKIIRAMIRTRLGFFQVQLGSVLRRAIEFSQTPLCKTPERLDIVDIPLTTGERIVNMEWVSWFNNHCYRD